METVNVNQLIKHTTCRHCEQDIEGVAPYRKGEWRDRGNNTHCPNAAGDAGQVHQPTSFGAVLKEVAWKPLMLISF